MSESTTGAALIAALIAWQTDHGLDNRALAERCGYSRVYWSKLKAAEEPVTVTFARRVYHAFRDAPAVRDAARAFIRAWLATTPVTVRRAAGDADRDLVEVSA